MASHRTQGLLFAAGLVVALTLPALPALAENPKIAVSTDVTVIDSVSPGGGSKVFKASDLRALVSEGGLREHDSGPVIIYGEHSGDQGVWRFKGVRLVDLLKLATGYQERMDSALYRKRKGLYVAAYASDGYEGVLSWSELMFNPTGSLALVAYEWKLAKAANAGERPPFVGDLVLVVPTDTFSGAREIQALKSIELRHVGAPAAAERK